MRGAGALLTATLLLVGCDAITGLIAEPQRGPEPCNQRFNAVRCQAMADTAAQHIHATREDVMSVAIAPDPTPEVRNGVTILQTRGGAAPIVLLVTLQDGSTHPVSMCGGIPSGPACSDDPQVEVHAMSLDAGYRDVPEGSTPVPSIAPDALDMATGLRIDRLDIPIDHTGPHEIVLGRASLPNGLLTTAEFSLVDDWPSNVTILEGGVSLEIRSQVDGKVIWNIYEHGWREGIEGVDAVLVFDVFRFEPGAKLSIQDLVVQ